MSDSTKTVYYDEGPVKLTFGDAGSFQIGVPRAIPSFLADILIRKGLVKEYVDVATNPTTTRKRKTEV